MKHKKFTQTERTLLSQWLEEKVGKKECARRLGRDVRTIQREIIRNKVRVAVGDNDWEMIYEPVHAQQVAMQRKQKAWDAKQPLKSKKIFSYVMEHLRASWSPEQIAGRLKEVDHPTDKSWHICHETIYQFIYKKKTDMTKDGIRKLSILDKTKLGKDHASGLHTEYERVTSLTRIERMVRITADQAALCAQSIFGELPSHARRSTTLDNGSEHTNHKQFGLQTYFADPYASWQRGGNENANLWIRYYFPKRTDFSTITDEELRDVEWELNNRPRKRLKFKTPQEVFSEYLNFT